MRWLDASAHQRKSQTEAGLQRLLLTTWENLLTVTRQTSLQVFLKDHPSCPSLFHSVLAVVLSPPQYVGHPQGFAPEPNLEVLGLPSEGQVWR